MISLLQCFSNPAKAVDQQGLFTYQKAELAKTPLARLHNNYDNYSEADNRPKYCGGIKCICRQGA